MLAKPFLVCTTIILSHLAGYCLAANKAAQTSGPATVSLTQLLASALRSNGQIGEALGEVEIARAQLGQANAALFPKASALLLAAPIFEETGGPTASTANYNKWGPYLRAGTEIVQPLYSFGMIGNYRKAAEHQVAAKQKLADVKRAEVIVTAKEMYYSLLMASELRQLVDHLMKFLSEAIDTAEKNNRNNRSSVKPHDLYRLKTSLDDLEQKRLYAHQATLTAERALLWVTGFDSEGIRPVPLVAEKFTLKTLPEYLALSRSHRPEFAALSLGQAARSALRDAKRAQSYPVLFLGAVADYNWSPVRERQPSIFANDPFNRFNAGVGLGFRFDLEFARHAAQASEQQAEYLKLKATESYAVPGIELQVKRAFWEMEQTLSGLEVARRRRATSKKWFISSAMGWSVGITPPKDLLEALEGDGLARKNYIETVFAYNMALAHLSQAVGTEVAELSD